ncbi:CGNR zinc finger domain-containing protein [Streptosporangium amethystogenes subsp. fukuiense]|uniref:CGNR zinc finger domain-containing protein n=1 Tax=Streptosporangium amethystogenes subsp. fukuiense TaxID=698418 RepID=A0ABW2T8S7_9ACTN
MDAVVGRVVGATAAALADGTWARLKACANDGCRWAFHDHSRSRTGRWCSMRLRGNRVDMPLRSSASSLESGPPSDDTASGARLPSSSRST